MRTICTASLFFLLWTTSASAQVTQQWVARYGGGLSSPGNNFLNAMAFNSTTETVYVTGSRFTESGGTYYATVAHDSSGKLLWTAAYNPIRFSTHVANAIAVDSSSGNVYVTGKSYGGSASGYDYATVAVNSGGTPLWAARYDGPVSGADIATKIAVDSSSGNVYVTGESDGGASGVDYATVAYDSSGNQLWVARYNGPGNGVDSPRAIAVDSSSGNVYVTGESDGGASGVDYATVAYDSSGNQLWVARYNGPGNGTDLPNAIAVDSTGNIYVTGSSDGGGSHSEYATVVYDSDGNQLWEARYHGPGTGVNSAGGIALDGTSGNIYVTGGSDADATTLAYDSSGNQLWEARYHGPGTGGGADAIAIDSSGNIYVTGETNAGGSRIDFATVAYDSSGNQLWEARYNGPANTDVAYAVAVSNTTGNVYVAGRSRGGAQSAGFYDYATIMYSQP